MQCAILAYTADDHWRVGIGDPTVLGWVTVAAYVMAVFLCWNATLAARRNNQKEETRFWCLFTGFALFLGVNKQLDLQTWFTLLGKHMAEKEGWYAERRSFQAAFIALILVLGIAGLILIWRLARNKVRHYGLALTGGMFLACFVVIRAASFHYVDQMLGLRLSNVPLNCLLELGGIACLAAGAFLSSRLEIRGSRSKAARL